MESKYKFDPDDFHLQMRQILSKLDTLDEIKEAEYFRILKKNPKNNQGLFSKSEVIQAFKHFHQEFGLKTSTTIFTEKLKKKPTRTISGVTPVTVLTKPFPCPGKCIFCPNDVRMPKSYLSEEPGAQRAARNSFDPYLQTYNRLRAFKANGHSIDKVELIILGGTWSFYPEKYQVWFIKRCFEAMNDFGAGLDGRKQVKKGHDFLDVEQSVKGSDMSTTYNMAVSKELVSRQSGKLITDSEEADWEELLLAQEINQTSKCRNVGLVIETRPDHISHEEVIRVRRLGATKTQVGFQSLSDKVLDLNNRGHDVAATRRAVQMLRLAGFKIHAHWMANLYGSSVRKDIADFKKLFSDPDFKPDELKIYPCSLIETAELMDYYNKGLWQPYNHQELLQVVTSAIKNTPEYCRLTRVIRDIPGGDIVVGNKKTNFRQYAEAELDRQGVIRKDIRSREIKGGTVKPAELRLKVTRYKTTVTQEYFIQYVTPENKIVAFLRLALPTVTPFIGEIKDSAMIREVHVYGVTVDIGKVDQGRAQHLGLGTKLIRKAQDIAKGRDFEKLAVISAIGTREYYAKLGFSQGELYQHLQI